MGNDSSYEEQPPAVGARLVRLAVVLFVLVVGGTLVAIFASRLPQGTGTGSLVVRAIIGLTIGGILIFLVRRMMRALGGAPPAPPQTVDARSSDIVYECLVCGTRLRLEVASTAKAPRHCGEEMEAKLVAG